MPRRPTHRMHTPSKTAYHPANPPFVTAVLARMVFSGGTGTIDANGFLGLETCDILNCDGLFFVNLADDHDDMADMDGMDDADAHDDEGDDHMDGVDDQDDDGDDNDMDDMDGHDDDDAEEEEHDDAAEGDDGSGPGVARS